MYKLCIKYVYVERAILILKITGNFFCKNINEKLVCDMEKYSNICDKFILIIG